MQFENMTDGELADIICRDYANNMVKDENNRYGWSYAYNASRIGQKMRNGGKADGRKTVIY